MQCSWCWGKPNLMECCWFTAPSFQNKLFHCTTGTWTSAWFVQVSRMHSPVFCSCSQHLLEQRPAQCWMSMISQYCFHYVYFILLRIHFFCKCYDVVLIIFIFVCMYTLVTVRWLLKCIIALPQEAGSICHSPCLCHPLCRLSYFAEFFHSSQLPFWDLLRG